MYCPRLPGRANPVCRKLNRLVVPEARAIGFRPAAAEGMSNTAIADKLDIHISSARKWRTRFVAQRLEGLLDAPRPGLPCTVVDEQVEAVITATLESTPRDATHWSTRSLAAELGMSQSAVSRICRAFGLAPHKQDSWKLSKDPLFVEP